MEKKHEHIRRYEDLLQQFQAPCVGKCRVHKGREGTHTAATIHISYPDTFYMPAGQLCFGCLLGQLWLPPRFSNTDIQC